MRRKLESPKFQESCYKKGIVSIIEMVLLRNYSFRFINQSLNWKPNFCRGEVISRFFVSEDCIKVLIIQVLRICVFKSDSPRYSKCVSR